MANDILSSIVEGNGVLGGSSVSNVSEVVESNMSEVEKAAQERGIKTRRAPLHPEITPVQFGKAWKETKDAGEGMSQFLARLGIDNTKENSQWAQGKRAQYSKVKRGDTFVASPMAKFLEPFSGSRRKTDLEAAAAELESLFSDE